MTRRDPLVRLLMVTLAVVLVDLVTKMIAITTLGTSDVELGGPFFLGLLYNDRMFAGLTTLGGWVNPASIATSAILLVLAIPVVRPLTRYDMSAPATLGLMSGAAIANPLSLVLQPAGVTDFLGIQLAETAVLFNVADVAAYIGVAYAGRMVMRLWAAHRTEVTARVRVPATPRRWTEREVGVPVWRDAALVATARLDVPARRVPMMNVGDETRDGIAEQRVR